MLTPEVVDQAVGRDHLICVQGQDREQCALAQAAEGYRLSTVHVQLERPEYAQPQNVPHVANGNSRVRGAQRARGAEIGPRQAW